jgi:hypothetical protein
MDRLRLFRHPRFVGVRTDKAAKDVRRDVTAMAMESRTPVKSPNMRLAPITYTATRSDDNHRGTIPDRHP